MTLVTKPCQLRQAVMAQHGGVATLAQTVPVHEAFNGHVVWDGVVHVFDLDGHPSATPRLCLVLAD